MGGFVCLYTFFYSNENFKMKMQTYVLILLDKQICAVI